MKLTYIMPSRATSTLLALSVVGILALLFPPPTPRQASTVGGELMTDAAAYRAIVDRMRGGEDYYASTGAILRARDYPTANIFNWRTPLHLTAISSAPWVVWRAVLTTLLVGFFAASLSSLDLRGLPQRFAVVLLVGVVVFESTWQAVYMSEAWAGVLIGCSLTAFAFRRKGLALSLGLLALFVRELSAPYCVACTIIAAGRRQWSEVGGWLMGAAAYAAYYARHSGHVTAHLVAADTPHAESWIQFGGLAFLQTTVMKLGWFALLPTPAAAVGVVLVVAGILNNSSPLHLRAASGSYVAFFLIAGLPFNDYWGLIAAPTWALAAAFGLSAILSDAGTIVARFNSGNTA